MLADISLNFSPDFLFHYHWKICEYLICRYLHKCHLIFFELLLMFNLPVSRGIFVTLKWFQSRLSWHFHYFAGPAYNYLNTWAILWFKKFSNFFAFVLFRRRRKQRKLDFFEFALDPSSFSQSVENIFWISFLVNNRQVVLDDNNEAGILEIYPNLSGSGGAGT